VYNHRVNRFKRFVAKLWKLVPAGLRWRAVLAVSPRFLVGVVGVVFNEKGEALLAHHVFRSPYAWGLPGGIINYREELPEALRREMWEEMRLHIEVGPLLQVGVGDVWPHVTFYFMCALEPPADGGSPEPQISGELLEAGFYPPDALPCALESSQAGALQYARQLYAQPDLPALTRIVEMEAS